MAARVLPTNPAPRKMTIGVVSAANELTSATNSADQEIDRKGTRFALTFEMPPMTYVTSMGWSDVRRKGVTVAMRVFQPGLVIPAAGTPRVKGGGQGGSTLIIDGLPNGYQMKKGQFFSVVISGQRYLYSLDADATANGSGEVSLLLEQMLRYPPADNAVVEVEQPIIEGFPRDVQEFEVGIERLVSLVFTVRETD